MFEVKYYIFNRFATEAAITILRIDDMIKLEPKKEESAGRTGPMGGMGGMPGMQMMGWYNLYFL